MYSGIQIRTKVAWRNEQLTSDTAYIDDLLGGVLCIC